MSSISPAIAATPALGPAAEQHDKLVRGAQQFEAILLEHWWSSMQQSTLGGDDNQDPTFATLQSCGLQAMCTAMAQGGGIGIARMLVSALQAKLPPSSGPAPAPSVATGDAGAKPAHASGTAARPRPAGETPTVR